MIYDEIYKALLISGCIDKRGVEPLESIPAGNIRLLVQKSSTFSDLVIQSMGYSDGKIFIDVASGRATSIANLKRALSEVYAGENGVSDFEIETTRVKSVAINLKDAQFSSRHGHFYQTVSERISCGSSCAPSDESYSGTFGAIVSKDNTFYILSNNHVFAAINHKVKGTHTYYQPKLSRFRKIQRACNDCDSNANHSTCQRSSRSSPCKRAGCCDRGSQRTRFS